MPATSPRLIIFDVDGTLLDANTTDYACFERAFHEVTGRSLTTEDWTRFTEITGRAIVHQALGADHPELSTLEIHIRDAYLAKLQEAHLEDATRLRAFAGTLTLLATLHGSADFKVAIATGCWRETSHFKLNAAGFDLTGIPFACTSDRYSRAEIITLAAERAGVPVEQAVYVGDGRWDLLATQQLGIPFIGTGRKVDALRKAGATYTVDDLSETSLREILREMEGIPSPFKAAVG